VSPQRYHLTLHFLGGFAGRLSPDLVHRAACAAASVRLAPFEFTLDAWGSFRTREAPFWLGCNEVPAALAALHGQLLDGLRRQGIPADDARPWVPHVTVLRGAERRAATPVPAVHWRVADFHLIDSQLAPRPEYVPLGCWPLLAGAC